MDYNGCLFLGAGAVNIYKSITLSGSVVCWTTWRLLLRKREVAFVYQAKSLLLCFLLLAETLNRRYSLNNKLAKIKTPKQLLLSSTVVADAAFYRRLYS